MRLIFLCMFQLMNKYHIDVEKEDTSQNVMCVCSFDMKFTYVVPGWAGSANDARILLECATNPDYGFPMLPQGKYLSNLLC